MIVIDYILIHYMNKKRNIVTVFGTLLAKIKVIYFASFVPRRASYAVNINNMSVPTRNKQGIAAFMKRLTIPSFLNSFMHSSEPVFVRSLFALCSLIVRLKKRRKSVYTGMHKHLNHNPNINFINTNSFYHGNF